MIVCSHNAEIIFYGNNKRLVFKSENLKGEVIELYLAMGDVYKNGVCVYYDGSSGVFEFAERGNHLWYLSSGMYFAVTSLPVRERGWEGGREGEGREREGGREGGSERGRRERGRERGMRDGGEKDERERAREGGEKG